MNVVRRIAENFKLPYFTLSPTYSICPEHGYITGEEPKCLKCGAETEVYSRITGYYRPLKNWNDGKQKEYADRKEYVISGHGVVEDALAEVDQGLKLSDLKDVKLLLFTTHTCPNCDMIKEFLQKEKVEYDIIVADENTELTTKYNIKQVPTLVVESKDSVEKYNNFSNIISFINN